ncbi:MAG: hypothetical protein HYW57_00605 [Ignavibacteriales bacterium]|nr:hypothetical protein [Ignavibacteriales bacterium]
MKASHLSGIVVAALVMTTTSVSQTKSLSYKQDVQPVVKQYCLPCHLEESENPSDLFMDDFEKLSKGGRNGPAVLAQKPKESNFYLKLLPDPPFGKQMPRTKKKLKDDEVKLIYDWILQGAKP